MRTFLVTFEIEFYDVDEDREMLEDMISEDLQELYSSQAEIDNVFVREI